MILEIEKYIMYNRNLRIKDLKKKRLLKGTFKIKGEKGIFKGDDFQAFEIQNFNAFETYKIYLDYFNHTTPYKMRKEERIAINAKWGEENKQNEIFGEWKE